MAYSFMSFCFMNPPAVPPVRILLVDDDLDDCMFFKDALAETGISTFLQIATRCNNILETIGSNREQLPQLVFLDLNMPSVSGQECLKIIRSAETLNNIPVIIYSTSASRQEVEETFDGGANLYLQKPSSFHLLVIALKKILQTDWTTIVSSRDLNNYVFKHKPLSVEAGT